jgi:4-amino-4-deoxy-L-arabinose transferase-like glycosyltransferase
VITLASTAIEAALASDQSDAGGGRPSPYERLIRGRADDQVWVRPALLALLAMTALLYLWDLGASGWAKTMYSAWAQSSSESWKAYLFGSLDSENFAASDTPPVPVWVMGISVRIFGLNPWAILVPQALAGVATVGLLYASVRRWFSPAAALLAGALLMLTPVATLMFRYNQPDAYLTLLLVAGAYCLIRATERGSTNWLLLASVSIGFGFLTKIIQALLVLPAFALVYLVTAPSPLSRRLRQLLLAGLGIVISSGWWIATVGLWPAADRPYIGETQHNNILELIFGANGLGKLLGAKADTSAAFSSTTPATGGGKLLGPYLGGQISWLIPAALLLLGTLAWSSFRTPRSDRTRAAVMLWGGWLLVTGLVFSVVRGKFHAYYTLELAPPLAALVGIGAVECWRQRNRTLGCAVLAASLSATAVWSFVLLGRTPDWLGWLRVVVLTGGLASAGAVLIIRRLGRRSTVIIAAFALLVGIAGPAAFSLQTALTGRTGDEPLAGPTAPRGPEGTEVIEAESPRDKNMPTAAVTALLRQNADKFTWVAATVGSYASSHLQLATKRPIMAVGGPTGSDPVPTLGQFQKLVNARKVHFFVVTDLSGRNPDRAGEIGRVLTQWVERTYTPIVVDSVTIYDLTAP